MISVGWAAPYIALCAAVMGASSGAVFARLADAHAFAKCAYRVSIAAAIYLPVAAAFCRGELRGISQRAIRASLASGAFLALHFLTWISSLDYTSVASSTVLVCTVPMWVALLGHAIGRPPLKPAVKRALMASIVGAVAVGYGDLSFDSRSLFGDGLALAGAVFAAAYMMCGSTARKDMSLPVYAVVCYGSAALVLWGVVLAAGVSASGFDAGTWRAIFGMALCAQVVGHSSYNYALGSLSTGMVAIAALCEPIGSSLMAFVLFGEMPGLMGLIGMAVILISTFVAAKNESSA